ncbi:acetyl-CoA synthetase-like protein [Lizonia empirigonia]|nr:acetyl-CoA synthetase-like protein [Lizonia empirigonia]
MVSSPSSLEAHEGLAKVWKANSVVPQPIDDCIHGVIEKITATQPRALAVKAWDGNLTYQELDDLASQLASRLGDLGIEEGDLVPLLFEKSMWAVVAALGVVKCGAGFLLLDHNLPLERLRIIVATSQCKLVLKSSLNNDLGAKLCEQSLPVGTDLGQNDRPRLSRASRQPDPSSIVYVVFTSGSTGVPKGCALSHRNLCSAMHYQNQDLGFRPGAMVFDFASYSFDVAVHNIFATLTSGGCLCIPSDTERRNDIEGSMARMRVTLANLTPTVARLLNPSAVPTLKTLILLGEPVTEIECNTWCGKVQVINSYGPAECTPISTFNHTASTPNELAHSGRGKGVTPWIVNTQDHNALSCWGDVGELLLEGPIVGLGYLHNAEKTATAFVEDPDWLVRGAFGVPGRRGRLYRTGDLARYDANGNIAILGRVDTQVKIRGNRVELGEVEFCVRQCMPEVVQVVAEAVLLTGAEAGARVLAVFLEWPAAEVGEEGIPAKLIDVGDSVRDCLFHSLPVYMIPTLFFALAELPLTPTGKTDRKRLREIGSAFSTEMVAEVAWLKGPKTKPRTDTETMLQELWAGLLNINRDLIGADDNFFQLGADSITAMKLVGEVRKLNFRIVVAEIFQNPVLGDLAKVVKPADPEHAEELEARLAELERAHSVIRNAFLEDFKSFSGVALRTEDVADIIPLTDLQETLAVEGLLENRQIVDYYYLELDEHVHTSKLRAGCSQLLEAFPILRARLFLHERRHWLIVPSQLETPFQIVDLAPGSSLDATLSAHCLHDVVTFPRDQTLVAFTLLRYLGRGSRLIVRLSHVQYDGMSLPVIFQTLADSYRGEPSPARTPFSAYMAYIARRRQASMKYWRETLQGVRPLEPAFLSTPAPIDSRPRSFRVEKEMAFPTLSASITVGSFMSAAWAVFLARLLRRGSARAEGDVIYGQLVSGRNSAVPGIEDMVGCCINVIPLRIGLATLASSTMADIARSVQEQLVSVGDADSLGFQDLLDNCDIWPAGHKIVSCAQHQNVETRPAFEMDGTARQLRRFENPDRLPVFLYLVSYPRGKDLGVQIFAHTHIVTADMARALLEEFCPLVEKLSAMLKMESTAKLSGCI